MKKPAAAVAVLAVVLTASAYASGQRAGAKTVSSSRPILGGRVRCAATFNSSVAAGKRIDNTFSFRNVSGHPVWLAYQAGSLVLRSPDGTTYDTTLPLVIGGPTHGARIQPGVTRTEHVFTPRVRWSGPLRIVPKCDGKALPAIRVRVTAPAPAPSGRAAVAAVVKTAGFLLRHCRPRAHVVPVHGLVAAPGGSAPTMRAACSVSTRLEHGFVDAQLMVVMPPGRTVHLEQPYEQLRLPLHSPPVEAVAWEFVVTRRGATPVAWQTGYADHFTAHRFAPGWTWNRSGWKSASDDPCSGGEGTFSGNSGPTVYFISACPS